MNNIDKLVDLEKKIQYKFQDFGLLEMAMRHSSYANEHHMERLECNERLEFLGDAVLEVVSSEFLYKEATGGRHRDSIVSDAMEATIGAIFLDGGFEPAKTFVLNYILNDIEHKQLFYDSKTILQELIQGETDEEIVYTILKEEGPDHDKSFWAQVSVGKKALGTGKGRTKKAAEQAAAYDAILARKKA